MRQWKSKTVFLLVISALLLLVTACGQQNASNGGNTTSNQGSNSGNNTGSTAPKYYNGTVVFADAGWDSIRFANSIAGYIIKNGYGAKTKVTAGSTPATFLGLKQGDIDVYMEIWAGNIQKTWNDALQKKQVVKLGVNFNDDEQGMFVPTYMIKGDSSRNIKASAPDLKTVADLNKYWKLFKTSGSNGKGRIYGSPPGWAADKILSDNVYKKYGLDKNFEYFHPGSQTALFTSLASAYDAGKAWVGYGWTPTWIMGKYKMTYLKAPSGDKPAFPREDVYVAANADFAKKAPHIIDFLKHYTTDSAEINKALLYMQNNKAKPDAAAVWWLKNNESTWTQWVPANIAKKVKASLK